MNERIKQIAASSLIIKQLAKQAEEYADIEYNASDLDWYELKEEKFAELIVRECAEITDGLSKLYPRTDVAFDVGYTMGTSRATKEIKQHFGVEE